MPLPNYQKIRFLILILLLSFFWVNAAIADFSFRGQLSGWGGGLKTADKWQTPVGVRYLPEMNMGKNISEDMRIDLELLLNGFFATDFDEQNADVKLYRLKLRYTTAQSETRLGLQKISFGPAQLLRSLMWFDRLDPRDPLRMTEGVYGIRFTYNFLNNTNLWLWGLYGNHKTKGYEIFPTASQTPELGGRFQFPVPYGDFALTFHHRKVDAGSYCYPENRLALDGRWDTVIGWWFETVFQDNQSEALPYQWTKMVTLGADYTFGIGNGVHILVEHMATLLSRKVTGNQQDAQFSAVSLDYPLGIFDTIMALGYYSWEDSKFYQYLSWQRTYDNFILNLSLFHYPDSGVNLGQSDPHLPVTGYGAQLMLIFNH